MYKTGEEVENVTNKEKAERGWQMTYILDLAKKNFKLTVITV